MRRWLFTFVSCFALAAVGCGGASTSDIDASIGTIDAKQAGADARPLDGSLADASKPDASPPDASPPDARSPDASPPDASSPDAALPDAAATPDANLTADAVTPPDACSSDPRCNNAAGTHCDDNGGSIVCTAVTEGCFQVTGAPTSCPTHESCADGVGCKCDTDSKCAAGAGTYCDPGVAGSTYTCTIDANACVVAGTDTACPAPEVCSGAGPAAACACPAAGPGLGQTCDQPDQLTCGPDGNVLICQNVGSCTVWQTSVDCASLALTCNNNACVCPSNTSHNFYVGPNYDRSGAPANLSPNGLLTPNGLCTFQTLGQGLFVAASDVLLANAALARVVAVGLDGHGGNKPAVFAHEVFPLVVGNRTTLTTYQDPDPAVGGSGFNPADYVISFNSADTATGFGVAILLDPRVSSSGQPATPPPGGSTGFSGFTVQPTQANLDCSNPTSGADATDECPAGRDFGGGNLAVAATGGEMHLTALQLFGVGSDATFAARRLATAEPTERAMEVGLAFIDDDFPLAAAPIHADLTNAGGPWGTFDRILVKNFGSHGLDANFVDDASAAGILVATKNQGFTTAGVSHRAVFSHLDVRDCAIGYDHFAGNVTLTSDGSAVPNQIIGTVSSTTAGKSTTMAIGAIFGQDVILQEQFARFFVKLSGGLIDFDATGLFVTGADYAGVEMLNKYIHTTTDAGTGAVTGVITSSVRLTGGSISGTVLGDATSGTGDDGCVHGQCWGEGIIVWEGGALWDKSGDDTLQSDSSHFMDPSGDDVIVGGLAIDGTLVEGNYAEGVRVDDTHSFAFDFADQFGEPVYMGTMFSATDATIQHNGANLDDGANQPPGSYGHDGIFAAGNSDPGTGTKPVIVGLNGGIVTGNGLLGDTAQANSGERPIGSAAAVIPVFSYGDGIHVEGAMLSAVGTTISNHPLSGVYAQDRSVEGMVSLDGVTVTGNGADTCASSGKSTATTSYSGFTGMSCRESGLNIYNSGGFLMKHNTTVTQNGGFGVDIHSSPTESSALPPSCIIGSGLVPAACPLNVITGSKVTANGTGELRDDVIDQYQGFGGGAGVVIRSNGLAQIDKGSVIQGNKGPGISVHYDGALYLGDVLVDANGFNKGFLEGLPGAATQPSATVIPTPGSGLDIHHNGGVYINGTKANGAVFSNNAANGIGLIGFLDGLNFQATRNGADGILVATRNSRSIAKNVELDNNGEDGLNVLGGGQSNQQVRALAAPIVNPAAPPFDCAQNETGIAFTLAGDRPTVKSLTTVHDNKRNGASLGAATWDDGSAPQPNGQVDFICAQLGDADISNNAALGVFVGQPAGFPWAPAPDPVASSEFAFWTVAIILDNDVHTNGLNGLFVLPSGAGQASPAMGNVAFPSFAQNKFHNNALNQAVFDGGSGQYSTDRFPFNVDSPTGLCDAGANAFYCYSGGGTVGIFAQGESSLTVRDTEFQGGGVGLGDYGAQSGSLVSVDRSCTAISTCP